MAYEEREWIADEKARELLKKVLSQERIYYCFAFHEGKAGQFAPFASLQQSRMKRIGIAFAANLRIPQGLKGHLTVAS